MLISFAPIGSVVDAWRITEKDTGSNKLVEDVKPRQKKCEYEIQRYGAYFRGWCQVFGEHESILVSEHENCWLVGENKVGLVIPKPVLRQLNHEVLQHEELPAIRFCQHGVRIGSLRFPFKSNLERKVLGEIEQIIEAGPDLHLFLTSHLIYGNGSRIITISNKKPQPIVYRNIGTMRISLQ